MAKRINNQPIEAEYVEYAVTYTMDGEDFTTEPTDDYEFARLMRASLRGQIVARMVYETAWAEALDDVVS